MIIGEGFVFFAILIFGIIQLIKSIKKEMDLNRQKKNFLLSVTHELRTPLAAIKLNLQTLNKRELDRETQQKLLEKSESEVIRLENIVNNILAVTRLENSAKNLETIRFNISDLIHKQLEAIQVNFGINHQFELDIEKELEFQGDPNLVALIVSNLVENAIKYSPVNSIIYIKLKMEHGKVVLTVMDNGIGIAKEDREKIFEKFYRSENEDVRQTKGTGLGLYLVKNLVAEYKGTITIKSEERKGTEIKITL